MWLLIITFAMAAIGQYLNIIKKSDDDAIFGVALFTSVFGTIFLVVEIIFLIVIYSTPRNDLERYNDLNNKIKLIQECEDTNSTLYIDTVKSIEQKVNRWNEDYLSYKKHSKNVFINIFFPKSSIQDCDTIYFTVEYMIKEIHYDKGKE